MTSLEGFGFGDAGQPERRSGDVVSCPRVTVIAPVSPADRARSGHAPVEAAQYGFDLGPRKGQHGAAWQIAKLESEGPGE